MITLSPNMDRNSCKSNSETSCVTMDEKGGEFTDNFMYSCADSYPRKIVPLYRIVCASKRNSRTRVSRKDPRCPGLQYSPGQKHSLIQSPAWRQLQLEREPDCKK